jgi:hypothetical protein
VSVGLHDCNVIPLVADYHLAPSKSKNDERLKTMGLKDGLNNTRLQAESDMAAKKLQLSETRNRQASKDQAEEKIKELTASEKTTTTQIAVRSLLNVTCLD